MFVSKIFKEAWRGRWVNLFVVFFFLHILRYTHIAERKRSILEFLHVKFKVNVFLCDTKKRRRRSFFLVLTDSH